MIRKGVFLLGLLAGTSSIGQPIPPAPPERPQPAPPQPPADARAQKYQEAPGHSFLAQRYRLSREEAGRRLRLEDEVSETAGRLAEKYGEAFLASIIDHEPNYQVTFVFARDVPADEVRQAAGADLKPVVRVKRSRYTADEIRVRRDEVVKALAALRIPATIGYDHRTDKFEVTGSEEGGKKLLPTLPAGLRDEVRFVEGGTPARFQTGARAGDTVYGGWPLYQLTSGGGSRTCTYGFSVINPDNSNGITSNSGQHCKGTIGVIYDDGHQVTIPTPPVDDRYVYNNTFGAGRSYDFRVSRIGTLGTGPFTWFWNNLSGSYSQWIYGTGWVERTWKNSKPDYIAAGAYSRVIGVVPGNSGTSNVNHPQGATRCKGGFATGITCAPIRLSEAAAIIYLPDGSAETFYGYVKIAGGTNYQVLAWGGDSGAPVTTAPVWSIDAQQYEVRAAGIFAVGATRNRGDGYDRPCITPADEECAGYYMPIDRINDYQSIKISTLSGGVDPN